MSGSIIYTYVNGNPISYSDPRGLRGIGAVAANNLPQPSAQAMQSMLENQYGSVGATIIQEFSLFSLMPVHENMTSSYLVQDAVTAGSTAAKFGAYSVLSGMESSIASFAVGTMEFFGEVVASPLIVASTIINASVYNQARWSQSSNVCSK